MARRKRGKHAFSVGRSLLIAAGLAVLASVAWFGWRHWSRAETVTVAPVVPTPGAPKPAVPAKPEGMPARVTVTGQLAAAAPVRDAQIGVSAHAAMLLRHVEVFAGGDGRTGWNAPAQGFRAPFADARFVASELRLEGLSVDPAVLERQLKPVDYPVKAADLPPNMAATFTVRDGALYAGGDPAHPSPGTVRITYRVIPTGLVTLAGLRKGTHLTQ